MSNSTPEQYTNPEVHEATSTLMTVIKFLRDIVVIFLIAFAIRSFLVTPFQIQGVSMDDSFSDREYILVNTFGYLNFDTHFNEFLHSNPDPVSGTIAQLLKKIRIFVIPFMKMRWKVEIGKFVHQNIFMVVIIFFHRRSVDSKGDYEKSKYNCNHDNVSNNFLAKTPKTFKK